MEFTLDYMNKLFAKYIQLNKERNEVFNFLMENRGSDSSVLLGQFDRYEKLSDEVKAEALYICTTLSHDIVETNYIVDGK